MLKRLQKLDIFTHSVLEVKRIYIPKASGKPRPLGIPTIIDRVLQFVVLTALEPEWESYFEQGSYGFGPARSCHDAMARLYRTISKKRRRWVLDADIKGCFDNISHKWLLNRLSGFPAVSLIEKWLKAGYVEIGKIYVSDFGTPQGNIISPLLANIALHGMERALAIRYHPDGYVRPECKYSLVRYADDFVVLAKSKKDASKAKEILSEFFLSSGLEFSEDKTKIVEASEGFDFLGWTFRLFPDKRKKSKEVTLVVPSRKSVESVKRKLKAIWRTGVGRNIREMMRRLNQVIIGWVHYHRWVNANRTFRSLDHFNYLQAIRLIRRQHPNKSWKWLTSQYFTTIRGDRWVFWHKSSGFLLSKLRTYKILNDTSIKYGARPKDSSYYSYFQQRSSNRF